MLVLLIGSLAATTFCDAFTIRPSTNSVVDRSIFSAPPIKHATLSMSSAAEDQEQSTQETSAASLSPSIAQGSHDELLYALGVNLARQLGDIRPLVESGTELANVAKGLLDAVVGRLDEASQLELLKRRQMELNELLTSRA
jgi:hypothetical protein